jgi:tRNA 2-thiouridine synthesizing protein E
MTTTLVTIELNQKGFLAHFDDWNADLATALAAEAGLTLTDCHWNVIQFMRDYYVAHQIPPSPRVVVKSIGEEISEHVPCTRRHFDALFPNGGCRLACRIAGLPDYYLCGC